MSHTFDTGPPAVGGLVRHTTDEPVKAPSTITRPYEEDADPWATVSSHPASGITYQEADIDNATWARVIVEGREVVSPARHTDDVWRQYQGRVQRAIDGKDV
ncbi:hypothetical protein [Streptomyces acidiscabies]|uniref:Uncharacterized protein n=1 Tax=Streptomyces acidiscabies TaxID=42234 RepID=A0ABU4LW92_9ACTN|nr:hypothetical protein [Streptomyces acidiscabies]MDX3020029.1 hypothetical protein [Streptomyces acidiscabies]